MRFFRDSVAGAMEELFVSSVDDTVPKNIVADRGDASRDGDWKSSKVIARGEIKGQSVVENDEHG